MLSEAKNKKITWIDLEKPEAEEVKSLMTKFGIHPLVADELLKPTMRPKVDFYSDHIYLVLHFPLFDINKMAYYDCEVDFVLGKNFIIVSHNRPFVALHEMMKVFETDAILKENNLGKNPGMLLFFILRHLYEITDRQLERVRLNIDDIESHMFEKKKYKFHYDLVRKVSHVRKDTLDFSKSIQLHRDVLTSLEVKGQELFGQDFKYHLGNIMNEYSKTWRTLVGYREIVESLQETTDSLLSHRSNEIMKNLTIMAFVTFPLMLLTSIFGMNTKDMPIIGQAGDFWIVILIMVAATFGMYIFFKRKKWL